MAIAEANEPVESAIFMQGDVRDPLGVWGFRHGVTGDATGAPITVTVRVPADKRSAYVYTVYSAHISQLTGVITTALAKLRILTNWPNIDPQAGVQAYSSNVMGRVGGDAAFTPPTSGPFGFQSSYPWVAPQDRFILCYDPRQAETIGVLDILEFGLNDNTDGATYTFEAYGYFWDRSAMNAPGGPRHPGSA